MNSDLPGETPEAPAPEPIGSASGRSAVVSRLLWEALAIFIGVAAALWGQAWFEERADRIAERELLESVLTEMESNHESAGLAIGRVQRRRSELRAFHDFLGSETARLRPDSVVTGSIQLLGTGGPGVVSAAIDDALQSGNLRLIEDPSLRATLSRYQEGIRVLRERFDDHQDWTNQRVRAFLIENGRIGDHLHAGAFLGESMPPSRFSEGGRELIQSREFENIVRDQIVWYLEIEGNLRGFRDSLSGSIAQLQAVVGQDR